MIVSILCVVALASEIRSSDYPTITAAVEACAAKDGGRVIVPKGDHENVVAAVVFERFARIENVDGIKMDVTAHKVYPDAQR